MDQVYQVAASGLNLRELPDSGAEILTQLPRGHFVTRIDNRNWGEGWWRVEADQNLLTYQGYVSARFLTPYRPAQAGKPGRRNVTDADIFKISPNARKEFASRLAPALERELPLHKISTGLRIAHFMAQMAHESGGFRHLVELGSEAYFTRYDGRRDLGNTEPGDGARYKGRGIIQLTGRANYRRYGERLAIDLENNPERAADPDVAVKVACLYWTDRKINDPADLDDVSTVTRRINGGLNGIEDRIMKLKIAKTIWFDAPAMV